MPWRKSPLSMNAVPHSLKVPALEPPPKVTVSKTVPKPDAVPSQVTWRWTSPAGPGLLTNVVNLNAILLSVYPMPYAYPPYFDEIEFATTPRSSATPEPAPFATPSPIPTIRGMGQLLGCLGDRPDLVWPHSPPVAGDATQSDAHRECGDGLNVELYHAAVAAMEIQHLDVGPH